MKISFSNSAIGDLENIIEHYSDEGVAHIGQQFVQDIIEKIEVLADHPDLGRIVPEFQLTHIRELIYPPFRVVYFREKNAIKVIRIWRSERLLIFPSEA